MIPIQNRSNNDVLAPPPGATAEECTALPITRVIHPHPFLSNKSLSAVVSFWQPTQDQIELILAGKPVFIHILGETHPPIAIGVDGDGRLGF